MKHLLLFFYILLLTGCATKQEEQETIPPATVEVKTSQIRIGNIDETVTVSGSTKYKIESELRSPITGVITECKYYNGDKVEKNTVVALIRTKESHSAIIGAEQFLKSAITTEQREEAQKSVEAAKSTANSISLIAPFEGIISNKVKNELEVVSDGEAILSIIDQSSLFFMADAPLSSRSKIHTGQPVTISLATKPDKKFTGIVHIIETEVNAGNQTIPIQIHFTSLAEGVEGSLFGESVITVGEHKNVLLIPSSALLKDEENNSTSIMLFGIDSLAHKIEVETGLRTDSSVEVLSPMLNGESIVITQGNYGLPDSTKVRMQR